jgi:hypothetical protein
MTGERGRLARLALTWWCLPRAPFAPPFAAPFAAAEVI